MRSWLVLSVCLWPMAVQAGEVRVLAAASLRDLLQAAQATFVQQYPGERVVISAASSGTLARQIEAGAPADLFLSANAQWMDHLVAAGRIDPAQVHPWASNRLVVVGRGEPLERIDALLDLERIAIGNPESAPAGRYAQQLLQRQGLYEPLVRDHRLVMAKDVRQALLYAEQGVVSAAVVYASDGLLLERARVLFDPPAAMQPAIHYPLALTRQGEAKAAARRFAAFLSSAEISARLEDFGFTPLAPPSP